MGYGPDKLRVSPPISLQIKKASQFSCMIYNNDIIQYLQNIKEITHVACMFCEWGGYGPDTILWTKEYSSIITIFLQNALMTIVYMNRMFSQVNQLPIKNMFATIRTDR